MAYKVFKKSRVSLFKTISISTLLLFSFNSVALAGTVDDLRELHGEQRIDEQFSALEQWRISLEYAKIENHNRIARMFSNLEGIDVNSKAEKERLKITSDIKSKRKQFLTSFSSGKPIEIILADKATLDTLLYQKSQIKQIGTEIKMEVIPNTVKKQYKEVTKMVEEVKEMKPIGEIGIELESPVRGLFYLTSTFGMRLHPVDGIYAPHDGIDLYGQTGQDILSAWDGVVTGVLTTETGGNTIEITHGSNLKTKYLHLNGFNVKVGDIVKQYDTIGYLGSTGRVTGAHLHFEVHIDEQTVNPIYFFGNNGVNSLKTFLSITEDEFYSDMRPLMLSIKDRPAWMEELLKNKPSEKLFIGMRPVSFYKKSTPIKGGKDIRVKEGFEMPKPSDIIK
jgi:murein DD-endopeptidase MepM/ murein hydrolase activator NlpD